MTNEEIVERIKAGETELIEQLWGQVERFVRYRANIVAERIESAKGSAICDFDDLLQSGFFALLKAVDYWKPDSGNSFITHFANCLKTEMAVASFHRTAKQMSDPTVFARSLDAPISDDDETTLGEITADSRDPIKDLENEMYNEAARQAIGSLLGLLTENEREVIERHFFAGERYTEIAKDMKITKQRVNQLKDAAFRKIRRKAFVVPEAKFFREYVENHTNYSLHYGVSTFLRTHTSEVEALVFERDRLEREALMLMLTNSLPKDLKTPLELYQASINSLNRFDAYKKRQRKGRF